VVFNKKGGHMFDLKTISQFNDSHLIENFSISVQKERELLSEVIAHLSQILKRRLYAKEGYPSLFNYLREAFHYSESAAYRRIQAAKMTLLFPEVPGLIEKGKVNLTTLSLIEPHVNTENVGTIVAQVIEKSKREIEAILDSQFLTKRETVRDKIRRLPVFEDKRKGGVGTEETKVQKEEKRDCTVTSSEALGQEKLLAPVKGGGQFLLPTPESKPDSAAMELAAPEAKTAQIYTASSGSNSLHTGESEIVSEPVGRRRVKIEFCADEGMAEKLGRAKEVLRHKFPEGKFEDIFNQALEDLLDRRDPMRKIERATKREILETKAPIEIQRDEKRTTSRYIPQETKRKVWERDGGQCAYESPNGKRCDEKGFLEIDHIEPWALGGKSFEENLRLLCSQHNRWRAERTFGVPWKEGARL